MCEGSASIAVDRDVVEGACGGREVLPVGLLMRPRSDRGRSCERVNGCDICKLNVTHMKTRVIRAEAGNDRKQR